MHFEVGYDPTRITDLIYKALDKAKSVDGREELGLKWVKFNGVSERGMVFLIKFDCEDRGMKNSQEHEVMTSVVQTLASEGIHPITSSVNMNLHNEATPRATL